MNSPEGLHEIQISELMQVNKGLENFDVEIIPRGQKAEMRFDMPLHASQKKS